MPEETLFYPTHEYTLSNLTFALSVCADKYKEKIIHHQHQVKDKLANQIPSLPTTLKVEKSINVFLQTDDKDMVANIKKHYPLTSDDELSIFTALRELKNGF